MKLTTKQMVYSALFLAMGLVLPFLTGQIPQIGSALLPMHLPVMLCGFLCGAPSGFLVGLIVPLLRSMLWGMPPMPGAIAMAAELAVYGLVCGLFAGKKKNPGLVSIYAALITAMVLGRLAWGAVRFAIAGFSATAFPFAAFWAGAVANAIPGIVLQLILVPILVRALHRAGAAAV